MTKFTSIFAAMLILSAFTGIASSEIPGPGVVSEQTVVSVPAMVAADQAPNFTKMEISPRYGNFRLQPGENKEMTVTVKNKEKTAINVKPNVVIAPYGEFVMEKEWITVTPEVADIQPAASQKFTVKASIPADASIGYYGAQVAFTDEVIPTPYPQPFPDYFNSFRLSIDVWTPPVVQIQKSYITDQLEAGGEYDFKIKVKNTGSTAVPIDPKMSQQDMMYGPYGAIEGAFTDEAVTLTAPKEIPAGQVAEVNVHIKVPRDSKGNYHGAVDLGIDDPTIRDEWADLVRMDFGVWNQPSEPFVKTFSTQEAGPVTIEISSNLLNGIYGYIGYPGGQGANVKKTPSFKVDVTGSDNNAISLKKTKTVIKGGVSLGGMGDMYPPWESESEGIYQEMGTLYTETYTVDAPAGNMKLSILPQNTQGFEYTITTGG